MTQARQIFEQGIDENPAHAPLYHSLAELEAMVFNLEGLAKLNKKAAAIFNKDAMTPSPSSTQVWGYNIQKRRSRNSPKGVASLDKIGDTTPFDYQTTASDSDTTTSVIDTMSELGNGVVQDLMRADDCAMIILDDQTSDDNDNIGK